MNPESVATFVFLAVAVAGLWSTRTIWLIALTVAVALGYLGGVLTGLAGLWLALLAGFCLLYARARDATPAAWRIPVRVMALVAVVVLALGLALHRLPGFHNVKVLSNVTFGPGAAPFSLWLNFDKTAAGILVIALCYRNLVRTRAQLIAALRRAWAPMALTLVVVLSISLLAGYVRWSPKWTPQFWLWAADNLLSTCMSEEGFFRAFIQAELLLCLGTSKWAAPVAVSVSAALFGLAHLAGGWTYVTVATVAGLGYAIVFQLTRRVEMSILTHFSVNSLHFLLLTYPFAI